MRQKRWTVTTVGGEVAGRFVITSVRDREEGVCLAREMIREAAGRGRQFDVVEVRWGMEVVLRWRRPVRS